MQSMPILIYINSILPWVLTYPILFQDSYSAVQWFNSVALL